MKILHIISCLEFGGAQRVMLELSKSSIEINHEVSIISIYGKNAYEAEIPPNITLQILSNKRNIDIKNPVILLRNSAKLLRLIRHAKPDVIHTHLFMPKILLIPIVLLIKSRVIQTQHDNSPWWSRSTTLARIMTFIEAVYSKYVVSHNVAISKSVKEDLIKNCNLSLRDITVIYNGVAENKYYRTKENLFKEELKIFLVSRLDWKKKGLDFFIRISECIIKDGSIGPVKFIVIGDGKDKSRMVNLVKELQLSDYYEFRGYQDDVYLHLREADLLVIPSRWEGFGLVAAEAAMSGVPVVGSAVGGLQEVVIDNLTGFLCEVGDIECYVNRIKLLYQNRALYSSVSNASRAYSVQLFSQSKMYSEYEKIYFKYS